MGDNRLKMETQINQLQAGNTSSIPVKEKLDAKFRATGFMIDATAFHFGNMHAETDLVHPFKFLYFSFIILTTMVMG